MDVDNPTIDCESPKSTFSFKSLDNEEKMTKKDLLGSDWDENYLESPPSNKKTRSTPVKFPFGKKKSYIQSLAPTPKIDTLKTMSTKIEEKPKTEEKNPKIEEKTEEKKEEKKPKTEEKKEEKKPIKKRNTDIVDIIRSKIPNYSQMTPEEQALARSTFRAKFIILRDSWRNYNIPDINDNMSLEEIHECYEIYVKNIRVSENSGKYKVYLVILWLFIEYACCRIGLNVSGYTMSQLKAMTKYENLLIKLGERSYKQTSYEEKEQYPVEFDILVMALINAVVFIVVKLLCDSMNMNESLANNLVDTISSYLGGDVQPGAALFGGNASTNTPQISSVPQNNNPLGNMNLPDMIANLGSMFMNTQRAPQAQRAAATSETVPKTPVKNFKPAYDD